MSKITFRADDDLIAQLEEFEASKSEIMREALREYLDEGESTRVSASDTASDADSLDGLVADRVDALIQERLNRSFTPSQPQDINVNISLDGEAQTGAAVEQTGSTDASHTAEDASHAQPSDSSHGTDDRKTSREHDDDGDTQTRNTCTQCGEIVESGHVYCPNCGEKASHRVFCDCGDELRSDWGFCPSCGRRTPAADVLDQP